MRTTRRGGCGCCVQEGGGCLLLRTGLLLAHLACLLRAARLNFRPSLHHISKHLSTTTNTIQQPPLSHPSQAEYLYYDAAARRWSRARPPACTLAGLGTPAPGPPGFAFLNNTPRTEVRSHKTHVIYRNLWYNNGRWYALVDGPKPVDAWHFSRNQVRRRSLLLLLLLAAFNLFFVWAIAGLSLLLSLSQNERRPCGGVRAAESANTTHTCSQPTTQTTALVPPHPTPPHTRPHRRSARCTFQTRAPLPAP